MRFAISSFLLRLAAILLLAAASAAAAPRIEDNTIILEGGLHVPRRHR